MRRARLMGETFDLETLHELFGVGEPRIVVDADSYYIASVDFDSFGADHSGLLDHADQLVRQLNGAATIASSQHKATRTDGTIIDPDGHQHAVIMAGTIGVRSKLFTPAVGGATSSRPPKSVGRVLIETASKNASAAAVLRRFGSGDLDFVNLYRILDDIRDACGGLDQIVARGLATRAEIHRFTATANHPQVLGDQSRHGGAGGPVPKTAPMTEAEARSFIRGVAQAWLTTL